MRDRQRKPDRWAGRQSGSADIARHVSRETGADRQVSRETGADRQASRETGADRQVSRETGADRQVSRETGLSQRSKQFYCFISCEGLSLKTVSTDR